MLPEAMRMDKGAVFVATALAAAVGSIIYGCDRKVSNWTCSGNGILTRSLHFQSC